MTSLRRFLIIALTALALAGSAWAEPTTAEYLSWLDGRRELWTQEMKRMEAHEHGQYRNDYLQLSEQMTSVREQAAELSRAQGTTAEALRRQLFEQVMRVERSLELLLSEVPELAGAP